jgi:hypothetical protein
MSARKIPDGKKILRAIAEIAFSEEKTADRLRALDLLSEMITEEAEREEAMEKLDAVLSRLGEE